MDDLPDDVSLSLEHRGEVATIWFELAMEDVGWASLYLGVDGGSRGVTQTLRLALSHVGDPLPDFARFAEQACHCELPCAFWFDSEGPETEVSLRPGPGAGLAILDLRDRVAAAVYLVAVVDSRQVGRALARALRREAANPAVTGKWDDWYRHEDEDYPRHGDGFGNAWLRDLDESFLRLDDDRYGRDTYNATRYPSTRG